MLMILGVGSTNGWDILGQIFTHCPLGGVHVSGGRSTVKVATWLGFGNLGLI